MPFNEESAKCYKIATIPGDGIGTEVVDATVRVLTTLTDLLQTFRLDMIHIDWNSKNYLKRGCYIPDGGLEMLKTYDAILFGAVGLPEVPDYISLWGLILPIRKQASISDEILIPLYLYLPTQLNQYVNVRPIHILPTLQSPLRACESGSLDWVIVRENSEGEYAGQGGTTHDDTPWSIATDVSVFTRKGVERTMRFAFEIARSRPRKLLTMVTKSNAQRHGMVLWDKVFDIVKREYPDIKTDKAIVDAMTVRMVLKPTTLDTIVATNLHGDILSDLAAALSGGIGVAPSSNLDPTRSYPSMFEPIHGSAPDISGMGIANPVGTLWCAVEMLRWLKERDAADALMEAIYNITAAGVKTRDLGGSASTEEVTLALVQELERTLKH